jgi:hypothetical protein
MHIRRWARAALFLLVAFAGGMAGSWITTPDAPQAGLIDGGKGRIAGTFGVGGVTLRDGSLWQYRPDKEKWMPLDESFALEGQGTTIFPLPVRVNQVRHMETFGFLVTEDDQCWLYNIDEHRWESVGTPP